ncbi:hypothetical protein BVRB_5g109690 isoform A [Beta vulgaris subsp. vulgaris]|uniref:uncharacterized protein LOC104893382 n=1 Tax=Beta vulgaris subsp. vulgaris TaxID=3555 RepID=UPI000540360C|nr:uncharacterized protein LOC104893382 [Beta vulgaris subsp. vulgaris]KMT11284.1 hypothetical protein BVRB_5g109690 isoform A [Beta vulgaris subsp. vulgaris]
MEFFSFRVHLFSLILFLSTFYCFSFDSSIHTINLENPQLTVKPVRLQGYTPKDYKDALSCERVHVVPRSRLKLESYSSSIRLTVAPSVVIPERLHNRIQICLHMNASIGICQCEKDAWKSVHKGIWGSMISPYEDKYIDVKYIGDVSGSVTVSVEEEFQRWRLICLGFGIILLLVAPIVSSWVPFYYSSTMAIGILLVVIILLFQGMKLLPTGRKNFFYLTIYGSILGAGSFLLHQFSILVNSILVNFGLGEEMHNPVSIFLLVGIVLAGAALGYWIVRRFVISDDGSVDVGIAQFVKWAMRIIASTFILQGTPDTLFAWATVVLCWLICLLVSSLKWPNSGDRNPHWRKAAKVANKHNRAEFLRRSPNNSPQGWKVLKSPNSAPNWWSSPVRGTGLAPPSINKKMNAQKHYYSSFHNVPKRKMSKKEWEDFTQESTRQAMVELTSSPEFSEWVIENADRIQLRDDDSSDETLGSGSDSTDETVVDNVPRMGLFKW